MFSRYKQCDSISEVKRSFRLHIRRNEHVTNALRNWMEQGTTKPIKSTSAFWYTDGKDIAGC